MGIIPDCERDEFWMRQALDCAAQAEQVGEIPIGAVVIRDGELLGMGWNRSINDHDPSAHAEIQALRAAGKYSGNYRLPGSILYVTLEPCIMCAGAMVHARVAQVIYGAADPRWGACGSVFNLLPTDQRFNHRTDCYGGILAVLCAERLQNFFRSRRVKLINQNLVLNNNFNF